MTARERIAELDQQYLWHPFTQQRGWSEEEPVVVESAEGSRLFDIEGNSYIDGVSSLWCNVHGHCHPVIDAAVKDQLSRVAHSTMLGLTHAPAADLARRLVEIAPGDLRRVFYSDSGSTAVEIALKMAFQYWQQRGGRHQRRTGFVSLVEAYHGDTIGSVSVGGMDLFHAAYAPLLFPAHQIDAGDVEALERVLDCHGDELAAVVVEPLVQGAAGIKVTSPGFLREVRRLCDEYEILMICDEVATGFGRTGTMFACEQERVEPDMLCLGKGLTNGYMPLAATMATEEIYSGFLGEFEEFRTFFHGHTFTGNPLACAAAIANLDVFEAERTLVRLQPKIRLLHDILEPVAAMDEVGEVRGRGFMVGIDLGEHDPSLRMGHRVTVEARERGAIIRPLGDTVVLMPQLSITKAELVELVEITVAAIRAAYESAYPAEGGAVPIGSLTAAADAGQSIEAASQAA